MKKGFRLENVCYRYDNQMKKDSENILDHISLEIEPGEYVAVVGKTGSGKSTLLQQLNGLLKPSEGTCFYNGKDIHEKGYDIREHRMKVALCFQYPEYQLFEETVLDDVCFGPKNQGLSEKECLIKARVAMRFLGLPSSMEQTSPFMLSGGQQRKVALAGLLAMNPEVLILDEPVAGLDYASKQSLFKLLKELNERDKMTIILVSHDMDEVAEHARRVIVLNQGKIHADGSVNTVLNNEKIMSEADLMVPKATSFYEKLTAKGFGKIKESEIPLTPGELAEYIAGGLQV